MTFGCIETLGKISCLKCKTSYLLKCQTMPVREAEILRCPKCNAILKEYKESRSYWVEELAIK